MITTREAAPAVRLNADWQAKYRLRAQNFLLQIDQQHQAAIAADGQPHLDKLHLSQHQENATVGHGKLHHQQDEQQDTLPDVGFVCIVGRSGVGKASLINHLLQERAARLSRFEADLEERNYDYHGLFCLREIPGYDGFHLVDPPSRSERFRRRFHRSRHGSRHSKGSKGHSSNSSHNSHSSHSSHSSGHGSSNGKGRKLDLDEFAQTYGLFEAETKAIIFVLNSRVTPDDEKLMELAVEHRKFFSIVCTHADNLVQIADNALVKRRLDELEGKLRKDLNLIQNLNVRIFIVSIPFPEGQATEATLEGPDLECVTRNIQNLHFPLLQAYLSEPRGLLDELQIQAFVEEEVCNALDSFQNVKKRHQALEFTEHLAAGLLLPIAGPVMVSFLKALYYTLKACHEVGLVEDADGAMNKVTAHASTQGMSSKIASKEGLLTTVHESLIEIFGKVVVEIALAEVVVGAADVALSGGLPLVGPVISAASMPSRFKKIGEKLAVKACLLHELWIMQNITGLLEKS